MQNYSHLDAAGMELIQQATDEESSLCHTSIVPERLYVFRWQAYMQKFFPFPGPFKDRLDLDGQPSKSAQVTDAAWSRVLGKDPLPKAVLQSRLYATHNISVGRRVRACTTSARPLLT